MSTNSKVDVKTFFVEKAMAEVSAGSQDPWGTIANYDDTIPPPYSKHQLAMQADEHGYTRGTLDAITDNTSAFGGRLVAFDDVDETTEDAIAAKLASRNFISNIGLGGESLTQIRKKVASDLARTGEAYLEVLINKRGRPVALNHVPSVQIRITTEGPLVKAPRAIVVDKGNGPTIETRVEWRRFRRYCQRRADGSLTWFKEWGDPRLISSVTGKEDGAKDEPATSLIRFYNYSSHSPYGIPPWASAAIDNRGAVGVAELNLGMIGANAIPALAILVSGGRLTEGSNDRIMQFLESSGKTRKSHAAILLMEGESSLETDPNGAKIELKPLTNDQRDDSLFGKYMDQCDAQISAATRVAPMFVGRGQADEEMRRLVDEQVFGPLRQAFDEVFNAQLLIYYSKGIWYYSSRVPSVTSAAVQANMLATLERTGGINPDISRRVAEGIFPDAAEGAGWDPSLNRYRPYSLTLVENAKKQQGGKKTTEGDKMPGEPGHQVAPMVPAIDPGPDGKQKP